CGRSSTGRTWPGATRPRSPARTCSCSPPEAPRVVLPRDRLLTLHAGRRMREDPRKDVTCGGLPHPEGPPDGWPEVPPSTRVRQMPCSARLLGMNSLTVRMARWSAGHPWRALVGWLLFVALCLGVGSAVGTHNAKTADYRVGEAGRAEAMAAEGH